MAYKSVAKITWKNPDSTVFGIVENSANAVVPTADAFLETNGDFSESVVTASSPNIENLVNSKQQFSGKMGYGTATSSGNFNNYIQAKYGVAISHVPPQPKYGVMINPPSGVIQPKYGVVLPGTGQDLNITYNQLEEIIATLKKSISSLKNSWEVETKRNVAKLDNSWVGEDCASYTSKLTGMDKKVTNTIAALELLCSTYEQARDMVKENQAKNISAIESAISR
ncbi:MAG: hypothetical protein IJI58_02130 [Bacilli bacterium]|nr:hypothetical protein [Bacilli bacterium]